MATHRRKYDPKKIVLTILRNIELTAKGRGIPMTDIYPIFDCTSTWCDRHKKIENMTVKELLDAAEQFNKTPEELMKQIDF